MTNAEARRRRDEAALAVEMIAYLHALPPQGLPAARRFFGMTYLEAFIAVDDQSERCRQAYLAAHRARSPVAMTS